MRDNNFRAKTQNKKKPKKNKKLSILYPNRHPSYGKNVTEISFGSGAYIYDSKGREYLDANSGLWNVSLGYQNKEIIKAINLQLKKISFVNIFEFTSPALLNLSELLHEFSFNKFEKSKARLGNKNVRYSKGIKVIVKYINNIKSNF